MAQEITFQDIKSVSLSGLLMLVGMVMYISVFKAEVGSKLRPRSSFQVSPIYDFQLIQKERKQKKKRFIFIFSNKHFPRYLFNLEIRLKFQYF